MSNAPVSTSQVRFCHPLPHAHDRQQTLPSEADSGGITSSHYED